MANVKILGDYANNIWPEGKVIINRTVHNTALLEVIVRNYVEETVMMMVL